MRKKKAVENYLGKTEQAPDCSTCIKRKECERYRENSFCTQWAAKEPEPAGPDPNELWKRGEEVAF